MANSTLILFVTLDKDRASADQRYADRFSGRETFIWQSQNKTRKSGTHGQLLSDPAQEVHLFVRKRKLSTSGKAAPSYYCGQLTFCSWEGEQPITIDWHLQTPLSAELAALFVDS